MMKEGISLQFFYAERYARIRSVVSITIVLALIFTLWPQATFDVLAAPAPKPVELEHMRTATSKTYISPDKKTYTLEEYLEPIHYKKGDKWVEIDNEIKEIKEVKLKKAAAADDAELSLANGGNQFQVGFAPRSRGKKVVRLQLGQAHIDFGLVDGANVAAKKDKNKVTYPSVYPNTDLSYYVTNTGFKEAWILQKYTGQSTYTLSLKTKNVDVKQEKDGSLSFLDNKGNTVFAIPRPFMVDANDEQSFGARYELRKEKNQTFIDLKVDTAWLKDEKRAYPVVIDPSVSVQGALKTYDATVTNSTNGKNVNFGTSSYLLTGTYTDPTYGTGEYRSYLKFALSPLLSGANISSARITLNQYATTHAEQVNVYQVNSDWNSTDIKGSNQPSTGTTPISTKTVGAVGAYDFDITSLTKQWYAGTSSNYGVMLRLNSESNNRKGFRSSDYLDPDPNNSQKPKLTITYTIDPIGVESFWTTVASNVNTYNGNYYLQDTDVSISGRGPGLSVERAYNSRSNKSGIFGYGWISNLEQSLSMDSSGPVAYTDADGTTHTFTPEYGSGGVSTGTYKAPGGVNLELVKNSNGTFTLITSDQTKYNFNSAKKLASIVDSNNNTTTIAYTDNLPTSITDASGRQITLAYDTNNRVSKVTDPANRSVEYTYDANGNLTGITHKDAMGAVVSTESYGYDDNHNLTSITDPNNHTKTISYDTDSDRVNTVSYPITVNGAKQTAKTTFSYDAVNNTTTVIDPKGTKTIYTHNTYGNVIQTTQDPTGFNIKNTFDYDDKNQLISHKDGNANATDSTGTYNYTYDEKGNLTSTSTPLNNTSSTTYDSKNNPVTETDANGNTTTNEYDDKNNLTASTDPVEKSTATKYNAYGNVLSETSAMSPGNNLAINGSFELDRNSDNWPDNWSKVPSGSVNISWDSTGLTTDGITLGNKSIKISNVSGATAIASDKVAYDPNKTYVLSGYVKTSGAQGRGSIYAFAFNSKTGASTAIAGAGITGTQEATRIHLSLDPGTLTGYDQLQIRGYISGINGQYGGTYWFDGLQIEEGHYGAYNVLENSDFERDIDPAGDKIPDRWYLQGDTAAGDGLDATETYSGVRSVKLVGDSAKYKTVYQDVNLKGGAGSILTVSGFSKTENPNPNGIYGYIINTYDSSVGTNVVEKFTFNFDRSKSHDWQHIASEIKTTKPFDRIRVYYEYSNQTGTAWFDTAKVVPDAITTYHGYDSNNNYETSTTDPEQRVTQRTYDTVGNTTSEKVGLDTTKFTYDALDRLTKVTDAKNHTTEYQYDAAGNKTKVINAKNKETTYTYNELNQIKSVTDANNKTTTYDYDLNGNQTKITYPNGNSVSYGYDSVNRQDVISYNGTQTYTFNYDANNNLTKETDVVSGKSTEYAYDADNRLKQVKEPNGNQTDYTYDANGNVTQQKLTAGSTVITQDYGYNGNNQLTKITSNGTNQAWFNYNEQDQVARRKTADGNMTFNRYNGAGDLIARDIFDKNGNQIDSFVYTYNNKGNITSVTSKAGTTSYVYDELDQLTKETRPDGTTYEYTYDAVGNRLTKKVTSPSGTVTTTTYTYDDADQLTSVNGTTYTYDTNGNLLSDGNKTYVYDVDNRLTTVKDSAGNTIASFTYRADGMRKTMTTASGTITFHYDQNNNVAYETDQSGAVVASYTYGSENEPVSMFRGGKTYFYQLNGHGDVVALTDQTGAVVNTYTYDAFGNLVNQTGTVENPYTYAGYRYDKETGLYYLQSRYYNPETGRFLTRDTFEGFEKEPLSLNKYTYAENNPVNSIDPTGRWSFKRSLKKLLHRVVSALFSDMRQNTLTNIAFLFLGGFGAGFKTYRKLRSEFHLFEKYILRRSFKSFLRGALGGYLLGNVIGTASRIASAGNKLFNYEGWFDRTHVGRSIDKGLTRVERYLHNRINRW
jgi:RHS repeat-associated protein